MEFLEFYEINVDCSGTNMTGYCLFNRSNNVLEVNRACHDSKQFKYGHVIDRNFIVLSTMVVWSPQS